MTTQSKFFAILTLLCAVFSVQTVLAQPPDGQNDPPPFEAQKRIAEFKKVKLLEILDLDEQKSEKFLVKYNAEQKKVQEARKQLDETVKELQQAIKKNQADKIKELTELSLKRHAEMQQAMTDMLKNIRPVLNDTEYAKFLVFEGRFPDEVRRAIMEMRQGGGGMRQGNDRPMKNR